MATEAVFTTAAASTNFVSPWVPLNINSDNFGYAVVLKKTGTQGEIQAKVQTTLDNVLMAGVSANITQIASFSAQASEGTAISMTTPARAVRVQVSASTSSSFSFRVLQPGV